MSGESLGAGGSSASKKAWEESFQSEGEKQEQPSTQAEQVAKLVGTGTLGTAREALKQRAEDRWAEIDGLQEELQDLGPENQPGYFSQDAMKQEQARIAASGDDDKRSEIQRHLNQLVNDLTQVRRDENLLEQTEQFLNGRKPADVAADLRHKLERYQADYKEISEELADLLPENYAGYFSYDQVQQLKAHADYENDRSRRESLERQKQAMEAEMKKLEDDLVFAEALPPDILDEEGGAKDKPKGGDPEDKPKDKAEREQQIDDETEREKKRIQEEIDRAEREEAERLAIEQELLGEQYVAVETDMSYDAARKALDAADQELAKERTQKGFFKRLWRGTLMREYYKIQYAIDYKMGRRKIEDDGKSLTLAEYMERKYKKSTLERFVRGVTESAEYIDERTGEKVVRADAEHEAEVKEVYAWYVNATVDGGDPTKLDAEFRNKMATLSAAARDRGGENGVIFDNHLENARKMAANAVRAHDYGISTERVLEGFKLYEAEARSGVKTEAHRKAVENLFANLDSNNKLFNRDTATAVVQGIAGAYSVGAALWSTGGRMVAGVAGGLAASGVAAGVRQYGHITQERVEMQRNLALGQTYDGITDEIKGGTRVERKSRKREAKIFGTVVKMESAKDLMQQAENAMASGDKQQMLNAFAAIDVRSRLSSERQVDLVSFSSEAEMGDERIGMIQTKLELKKQMLAQGVTEDEIKLMDKQVTKGLSDMIDRKDKDFGKLRLLETLKATGKTVGISALTTFVGSETASALNENQVGLLEKLGILQTHNSEYARQTVFADLADFLTGGQPNPADVQVAASDTATQQELERAGWTKTGQTPGHYEEHTTYESMNIQNVPGRSEMNLEWADYGTPRSDFNETKIWDGGNGGGLKFVGHDVSILPNGTQIYPDEVLANHPEDFHAYLVRDGVKAEVQWYLNSAGEPTCGDNGILTLMDGSTYDWSQGGNVMFGVKTGVGANGLDNIASLATEVRRKIGEGIVNNVPTKVQSWVEGVASYMAPEASMGAAVPVVVPEVAIGAARPAVNGGPGSTPGTGVTSGAGGPTPGEVVAGHEERRDEARQRYRDEVEASRNLIGDRGVELLTAEFSENRIPDEMFESWYNGLSDDGKREVMRLSGTRAIINPEGIGNDFYNWVADNHPDRRI